MTVRFVGGRVGVVPAFPVESSGPGMLPEIGSRIAHRLGKPVVLTLYGTEIWHYRPKPFGPDLFTGAYRSADAVTFYSRRLLERAQELGLERPRAHVVYPPVAAAFHYHDRAASHAASTPLRSSSGSSGASRGGWARGGTLARRRKPSRN